MTTKIRIKVEGVEVECEATEEFLKGELPSLPGQSQLFISRQVSLGNQNRVKRITKVKSHREGLVGPSRVLLRPLPRN